MICHFKNFYNLIYFFVCVSTWFLRFEYQVIIYAFLLLDIIEKSDDLQNIIKSITINARQLTKLIGLGFCILYIYGSIVFVFFTGDWTLNHSQEVINFKIHCILNH